MEKDLFELSDNVKDEKSFIEFLVALREDREAEVEKEKANPSSPYDSGILGWENITIEDFLESAVAWAEVTKENSENYTIPDNPWKRIAHILHAGKTYE